MNRYLLDTSILLWFINGDRRLKKEYIDIIENNDFELYICIASLWEISIKYTLGRIEIEPDLQTFFQNNIIDYGIEILPIKPEHTVYLPNIPLLHNDPFDRIIYSQSITENISLLYSYIIFDKYNQLELKYEKQ